MTNELGRELTTDEHIAVATGQTTIMDVVHAEALKLNAEHGDLTDATRVVNIWPYGTQVMWISDVRVIAGFGMGYPSRSVAIRKGGYAHAGA